MKNTLNKTRKDLLICISGGRSSAMMGYHIHTSPQYADYNKLYVFTNTSMERKETIEFLQNIKNIWGIPIIALQGIYSTELKIGVKSQALDFDKLQMNGEVFSSMIAQVNKYKNIGVPNTATPYCSDYLKTRVAHDYARNYFGTTQYYKALGYRLEDTPKRISIPELEQNPLLLCPLLTDFNKPISNKELNTFFDHQPFKLELHSQYGNCELCWKKPNALLVKTLQHSTKFVPWHQHHEKKYKNTFFREKKSIDDLLHLAQSGTQISLEFDNFSDGCVCTF